MINPDYRRLRQLRLAVKQAEVELHLAIREQMGEGTKIAYERKSGYPLTGTVVSVLGFGGTTRLRVKADKTGKVYDISLYDVPALRNTLESQDSQEDNRD